MTKTPNTPNPDRLNVYFYRLINPHLKPASPHHNQAECYVAAKSQKDACAILGVRPDEMRNYGGITGQQPVINMALKEPGVVFVQFANDTYSRWDEINDPSKRIVLDVKDPELYGHTTEHPAFGVIQATRFSGRSNMFMVNHEQGHGIALTISTASLNRTGSSDRVMEERELIRIEMSEVQWARMLSSLNAGATPVTLQRYTHPVTGEYMTPILPDKHAADMDTFRDELKAKAAGSVEVLREAQARLAEIMKGPLRKGDLAEVEALLQRANMQAADSLPWVAKQGIKTIETAAEHSKASFDSYIDFAMQKLGERALGGQLMLALDRGVDPADVGRAVALALAPPTEPAQD